LKEALASAKFDIIGIDTSGDLDKISSISQTEGSDFFTDNIDSALLNKTIDIALHSAKDLPDEFPEGITVAAITDGIDKRDVLVVRRDLVDFLKDKDIPKSFSIATSSKRRKKQISQYFPDAVIKDIRGNIEERLSLLDNGYADGLVIAAAGLIRLGLEKRIFKYLPFTVHPLQGKLAFCIREDDLSLKTALEKIDTRKKWGKAYLVGGGPGDPELITVKAHRILETADIVLYDALVSAEVLNIIPKSVTKIECGKRKGNHSASQEEINNLIFTYIEKGKTIARLKGGDPLIFARGGEEIEFLKRNFADYDIVPGISAVQGVSAYCEIPLTRRGVSSSLLLLTGHPIESLEAPTPDFAGTIAIYMGATQTKKIASLFFQKGWLPDTPVIAVSNASLYNQEKRYMKLIDLASSQEKIKTPALLIIGKVAEYGKTKSRFEHKKKVLFTGTSPDKYRDYGEPVIRPMIELAPLDDKSNLHKAIRNINGYDAIVFTSKHAVRFFFEALYSSEKDARSLSELQVYSIGRVTSGELKNYGIIPDGQPVFESAEGLIEYFIKHKIRNKKIIIPRSNLAHPELPEGLRKIGNSVDTVDTYKNVAPSESPNIDFDFIDTVIFTSPSGVKNFKKIYKNRLKPGTEIITTGKITQQEVENEKIKT
jgi:uroporphyrinogen III methyltransferase/synthase